MIPKVNSIARIIACGGRKCAFLLFKFTFSKCTLVVVRDYEEKNIFSTLLNDVSQIIFEKALSFEVKEVIHSCPYAIHLPLPSHHALNQCICHRILYVSAWMCLLFFGQ